MFRVARVLGPSCLRVNGESVKTRNLQSPVGGAVIATTACQCCSCLPCHHPVTGCPAAALCSLGMSGDSVKTVLQSPVGGALIGSEYCSADVFRAALTSNVSSFGHIRQCSQKL